MLFEKLVEFVLENAGYFWQQTRAIVGNLI